MWKPPQPTCLFIKTLNDVGKSLHFKCLLCFSTWIWSPIGTRSCSVCVCVQFVQRTQHALSLKWTGNQTLIFAYLKSSSEKHPLSLSLSLLIQNHIYVHTNMHACSHTHTQKTHCREREKGEVGAGDGHGAHKSKKSYTVIVISAIIFITITIITITVLLPHMYPIPRIISSLSVAPGGCVIVCWCADTPAAVCTVTPVDSQPDGFFFTPYSGTAAVPGSPWQPWDGALEAITVVRWWHSNSYHYTSSKETQREEEGGREGGSWEGKGEMRQGRKDGWMGGDMGEGYRGRGKEGVEEQMKNKEKEERKKGNEGEMWKVNGGRQVKGVGRQRGNRHITQADRDGRAS